MVIDSRFQQWKKWLAVNKAKWRTHRERFLVEAAEWRLLLVLYTHVLLLYRCCRRCCPLKESRVCLDRIGLTSWFLKDTIPARRVTWEKFSVKQSQWCDVVVSRCLEEFLHGSLTPCYLMFQIEVLFRNAACCCVVILFVRFSLPRSLLSLSRSWSIPAASPPSSPPWVPTPARRSIEPHSRGAWPRQAGNLFVT